MKTVSLRTLLREPAKIKRLTRAGTTVSVTDNGRPLWLIQPVVTEEDNLRRRREMEEDLAAMLREPVSSISVSKLVIESRR